MTGITKKQGEEGIDLYSNKENKKTVTFKYILVKIFGHKKSFKAKSLIIHNNKGFQIQVDS